MKGILTEGIPAQRRFFGVPPRFLLLQSTFCSMNELRFGTPHKQVTNLAYFLFIDESGIDQTCSPYEVLAGVAVQDSRVWSLIMAIQQAEIQFFGQRISTDFLELKAKKLLKKKTFELASMLDPIPDEQRTAIVKQFLLEGQAAKRESRECRTTKKELAALGQAKIAFCKKVFEICGHHRAKTFASIVDNQAPRPGGHSFLRKDYTYLFERFYYFLEDQRFDNQGIVVFDELDRTRCNILLDQMSKYFKETAKGRLRSSLIVPEPFFVHSDLTTLVQVADLLAYIIVWGVRIGRLMNHPRREELKELADSVCSLRYRYVMGEEPAGEKREVWSFAIIEDLRPRDERADEKT